MSANGKWSEGEIVHSGPTITQDLEGEAESCRLRLPIAIVSKPACAFLSSFHSPTLARQILSAHEHAVRKITARVPSKK